MTELARQVDEYQWWRDALRGVRTPIDVNHPESGFYRMRDKRHGTSKRVAIWRDASGNLMATVDGRSADALEIWTWCAAYPIDEATYRAVERGEPWPDAAPGIDHNTVGLDDFDRLSAEIEEETRRALADLEATEISQQAVCDRFANWSDRIARLGKEAEGFRKAEKQPHVDAGRAVDQKWRPLTDTAQDAVKLIKAKVGEFLKAERARKAKEAAEAAERGEPVPDIKANAGGAVGRSIGLRRVKTAVIENFDACLAALKDDSDLRDLVQRKADAAARSGVALPGCRIETKEQAA